MYSKMKKVCSAVLPLRTRSTPLTTLVLDMDGTLTFTSCEELNNCDLCLEPYEGEDTSKVYVKLRPYAREFVAEISKYYEIVLFTAAEVRI